MAKLIRRILTVGGNFKMPRDTTVELMHEFMEQEGYDLDITDKRLHHEIYLSDARRVLPEKLRTVIRHPIKVKER